MDNTEYEEDIQLEDEDYSEDDYSEDDYDSEIDMDDSEDDFFEYDGNIEKESRRAQERFDKAQRQLDEYIQSKKDTPNNNEKKKDAKRRWYDMSPDSRMSGKPLLERIGYDKNAHTNSYKEQNFLDTKVKNSKVRIGIYLFFILAGVAVFIMHHAGVF